EKDPYTNESRFSFTVAAPSASYAVRQEMATVVVEGRIGYGRRRQYGTHRVKVTQGDNLLHEEFGRLRNPEVHLLRFPPRSADPHHTIARVLADRYLDPIRYELASMRHLEAVREESSRVIIASSPPQDDVGQRGQYAMPHLQRVLSRNDETAAFVQAHLAGIAGVDNVRFLSGTRGYVAHAKAINKSTGGESYLADFGFGVGQCLPVIVQ